MPEPGRRRERHVRWAQQFSSVSSLGDAYAPPTPPFGTPILLPSVDDDSSQGDSPATPPLTLPALAHPHAHAHSSPDSFRRPRADSPSSPRTTEGHSISCEPQSPITSGRGQDNRRLSGTALSSPLSPRGQAQRRASITSPTHFDSTAIELHPLLAGTSEAKLFWDALNRPTDESVSLQYPNGSITAVPAEVLQAAATNPPQKVMHILCGLPKVMVPLVINMGERTVHAPGNDTANSAGSSGHDSPRSSSSRSSLDTPDYVTIQVVIEEMYAYFRHRMSGEDFQALDQLRMPSLKDRVAIAFHQRCAVDEATHNSLAPSNTSSSVSHSSVGTAQSTPSERSGGLRRIDCLVGRTQFDRLDSNSGGWVARFGPPQSQGSR